MKLLRKKIFDLWYRFGVFGIYCTLRILYKFEVEGRDNIPLKGRLIIISNHQSHFDPPILGSGVRKRITLFMAKKELFKNFLFGRLIGSFGSFPVLRGTVDKGAFSKFDKNLEAGYAVAFFPEGTRSEDMTINKFKRASGKIIYEMKASVVPAVIYNSCKILPKGARFPRLFKKINLRYFPAVSYDEIKELVNDIADEKEKYGKISDYFYELIKKELQKG